VFHFVFRAVGFLSSTLCFVLLDLNVSRCAFCCWSSKFDLVFCGVGLHDSRGFVVLVYMIHVVLWCWFT
jgi:hypothetical protein